MGQQWNVNWNLKAFICDSLVLINPIPGDQEIMNNTKKTFQGYNIYLNNEFLDFTTDSFYLYIAPATGEYTFEVSAI